MFPDVATVEVATFVLAGTVAVLLAWTWYAHHLSGALVWWAIAYAFGALGTLLLFHGHSITLPYGHLADDLMHISAGFALWFGFRSFNGQRASIVPMLIICVLYIAAVEVVADATGFSRRSFIDAALIIVIGLSVLSINEVVSGRRGSASWRVLASAILIFHAFALTVRIILQVRGPVSANLGSDYYIHAALVIEPAVLPVLLGYALLALAFDRRNADTETIAERDALTGLLNRRGLKTWLDAGRHAAPLSIIVFDLDHFKSVNDTHGHAVGDGVLQEVAERIGEQTRGGDAFARIGGEEFVVLIPGTGVQGAMAMAERMRSALERDPLTVGDVTLNVTGSFGVFVTSAVSGAVSDHTIAVADEALYEAKRGGRNRVVLAEASRSAASSDTIA